MTHRVKLIPVFEITNYIDSIPSPQNGPFWEYVDDWENYNQLCNYINGFPHELRAYLPGSSIYEIAMITKENLTHLIKLKLREEEMEGDELLAFPGGYILNIDGCDLLFPQCCCDLETIENWIALTEIEKEPRPFYAGHPSPTVSKQENILLFDFLKTNSGERFSPPVPVEKLEITIEELNLALTDVEEKLEVIAERLLKINEKEKLGIPDIDKRIIFNQTL